MSDVVIGASLQVDTGNAAPSVKEVRENIKQLKEEVNGATAGSKEHVAALEKLKQANEQLNPSVKNQASTMSQLKDHLGATVPAFKGASEGASGFSNMLKALMANPIVLLIAAIVAGLKFLYESFKNSFDGGQKLEQVFAGLSAVVTVVTDRVFALGRAVIKFFSGDFKGAIADAKAAVSGVGDEIERVYTRTAELTKKLQDIRKEERADDLDKAEREKRLALLREQLNDESVPIAKRKAIALELKRDQEQNAKDDLERMKRKADIQIELLKQGTDGEKKHADEINEIRIGVLKGETENALETVRTNKVIRALDAQERQKEAEQERISKERKKEADKKAKEEAERLARVGRVQTIKEQHDYDKAELEREDRENKERVNNAVSHERDFTAHLKEMSDARIAIDKAEKEAKEQTLTAIGGALNAVADLIGKQTVAGKALAVASSIINTYQGATKALAQGGIAGIAGAIAVIASGLASVKQIVSTKIPNQSDGVSGPTGNTGLSTPAPLRPTQQSTNLNQDQVNQIGNAAAGGVVRAFVTEGDVTGNQQRIKMLNRMARLS